MSAYLMSAESLSYISNGLFRFFEYDSWNGSWYLNELRGIAGCGDPLGLFKALNDMNAEALHQRYSCVKEGNICDKNEYVKTDGGKRFELLKLHDEIETFMYQCCEGNVPESKLYKWVEKMDYRICCKIINLTRTEI